MHRFFFKLPKAPRPGKFMGIRTTTAASGTLSVGTMLDNVAFGVPETLRFEPRELARELMMRYL